MSNILYRLARNAYIAVLEVLDGRYLLKRSRGFKTLMSHIDAWSEDEMAALITGAADASEHGTDDVLDATLYISCQFDEAVPDILMAALTLQGRTGCDLSDAAEGIAILMALFDTDPSDCRLVCKNIRHVTTNTSLSVSEAVDLIQCIALHMWPTDRQLWEITTDIVGAYRCHQDADHTSESLLQAIGGTVTQQYESEQEDADE